MYNLIAGIKHFFEALGLQGLAINAGIESCLPGFPVPPDILLSAMVLSTPQKALLIALVCTIASVLGGLIGYTFGRCGGRPLFELWFKKHMDKLEAVEKMYEKYGSIAVLVSAFTPIPYNIFTIASGILRMNIFKFLGASILGRGGRFFLVSIVLMFFGETIKKYMDIVILLLTIAIIIFFVIVYKKGLKGVDNGRN